jgi:ParB family chromosome partitioning protein
VKVRIGGLGKGLDALLPLSDDKLPDTISRGGPAVLPLEDISANPDQPRKDFDPVSLEELAETIKTNGLLQPIIVEQTSPGKYIVIAGERRMRAARLAGLVEIPAIIKKFTREESFLVSILENLQREDLNPIEEAAAFKQLMDITGMNQEALAAKVGKNRATVANALRLLKLPPAVQAALKTRAISAGHARALLSVEDTVNRLALFQELISESLSVRETEKRAQALLDPNAPRRTGTAGGEEEGGAEGGDGTAGGGGQNEPAAKTRDPDLCAIENGFITALGTKVKIDGDFSGGVLKIEYYSASDLDRLYQIIHRQDRRD